MSYYLQFDGVGSVTLASSVTLSGSFRIDVRMNLDSAGVDQKALDDPDLTKRLDINIKADGTIGSRAYCHFEVDGVAATTVTFDQEIVFSIIRDSSDSDQSDRKVSVIGAKYNNVSIATMELFDIAIFNSSSTRTNFLNPSSSGGTGLSLPNDDDSSNNGALNNFGGTTNSWWVFYSAALEIAPFSINSVSASNNPSISYASALILLPASVDSSSASANPVIEYKAVINLTPSAINSLSVSLNPFVSTGQTQSIGNVTAGFADDLYSVKYKLSGITVNFKG
tara:strand:- start:731 stop:1573 length:843 start_codon:yes stop_codon:yes gene_type:complete